MSLDSHLCWQIYFVWVERMESGGGLKESKSRHHWRWIKEREKKAHFSIVQYTTLSFPTHHLGLTTSLLKKERREREREREKKNRERAVESSLLLFPPSLSAFSRRGKIYRESGEKRKKPRSDAKSPTFELRTPREKERFLLRSSTVVGNWLWQHRISGWGEKMQTRLWKWYLTVEIYRIGR